MPSSEKTKTKATGYGLRALLNWPSLVLFTILLMIGGVSGYTYARLADDRIVSGISVGGASIALMHRAEARQALKSRFDRPMHRPVTFARDGRAWTVTPAAAGLTPDYQTAIAQAWLIGRQGSLLDRYRARRRAGRDGVAIALAFFANQARWNEFCLSIEKEVSQQPVNAHITVDTAGTIGAKPSRNGLRLDRQQMALFLKKAVSEGGDGVISLPVTKASPELSDADITGWPLDCVLGVYTTKFSAGDVTRTHNLQMAAAALDNKVISPVGVFSFNNAVGPRVPDKGYLEAPVISENQLILGVGGGVCQVSGTLFNAALLAVLPIKERSNHSLPSTYLPLGRDATVVYGSVDFVFGNDTGYPLLIAASITGSRLTIALVGHRMADPLVELYVEIKTVIPFETFTENDPSLVAGTSVVTQQGQPGYKIQLWRTATWPDGHGERMAIGDICSYPPIAEIIKRGIGSPRYGGNMPPPALEPQAPADTAAASGG